MLYVKNLSINFIIIEIINSGSKRKKSANNTELPGDWFTWYGDFGISLVSKTGDLLRSSFPVRLFDTNQNHCCYYTNQKYALIKEKIWRHI